MDYRSLGCTGMQVSPLCLGAMMRWPGLAAVGAKRLDFLIECVCDVNIVVGLCPVQHPDLLHGPRLQRLVIEQCAAGEVVACVGVGGGQRDFASRPVVDVSARAKPGPVPFRAPRQQPSGSHLTDHPDDVIRQNIHGITPSKGPSSHSC
jgi:hypothetical protein